MDRYMNEWWIRVLDCQVSDWGQWSECNASCGTGIMTRTRKILQSPQNGGKHCPTLMQKRGCQGYRCHGHHDKKILRETALLLPAALSYSRHANDSHDIRRNLRLRYHDSYKHNRELEEAQQMVIDGPHSE
uniref:Spondin-like TSP1 domain-containing protein n=1 Tax=Glossina brevipalpis TaxID=37001 RepID=A0A1A9WAI9_9MUSC